MTEKFQKSNISFFRGKPVMPRKINLKPLSVTDISKLTGYSKSHISGVASGRMAPSRECLAKIEEVVQVAKDGRLEEWMIEKGLLETAEN